jgi:hypothetical protein
MISTMTSTKATSSSTTAPVSARIDLSQAQQKINQKLGTKERIDLYWSSLSLFLEEKVSKREWDNILQYQLGFDFGKCSNLIKIDVMLLTHKQHYSSIS